MQQQDNRSITSLGSSTSGISDCSLTSRNSRLATPRMSSAISPLAGTPEPLKAKVKGEWNTTTAREKVSKFPSKPVILITKKDEKEALLQQMVAPCTTVNPNIQQKNQVFKAMLRRASQAESSDHIPSSKFSNLVTKLTTTTEAAQSTVEEAWAGSPAPSPTMQGPAEDVVVKPKKVTAESTAAKLTENVVLKAKKVMAETAMKPTTSAKGANPVNKNKGLR